MRQTTTMISRIIHFITKPRSSDIEVAISICTGTGGLVGLISGIRNADNERNGYICRPVCYTALGTTAGFFFGLYYKYTMTAMICYDLFHVFHDSQKNNRNNKDAIK